MMQKYPLVSIITATYNGQKYIREAIESVIAQDYPNKEYLIINDASTDQTWEIIASYTEKYPRIRLINNEKNLERSLSRTRGIEESKGDLIAFLDDDDIWTSPQKLSKQVAFFLQNPDYSLLGTDVNVIDEHWTLTEKFIRIREKNHILKANFLKSNQFIFSTIMAKRVDLREVWWFVDGHFLGEDYELWLKLGQRGKIANLGEKLTAYRDRQGNTSNRNLLRLNRASLKLAWQFRTAYPNWRRALFSRMISFILPQSFYARNAQRKNKKPES